MIITLLVIFYFRWLIVDGLYTDQSDVYVYNVCKGQTPTTCHDVQEIKRAGVYRSQLPTVFLKSSQSYHRTFTRQIRP